MSVCPGQGNGCGECAICKREWLGISELFGSNPLCPQDVDDQYFVSIPAGAPARVVSRLFDTSQMPGIAFDAAFDADTIGACLGSVLPWVDCYEDEYVELILDWFGNDAGDVLQGRLPDVDPSVPASLRDAAGFENFRTLFHPNPAGFEVIACAVRAEYEGRSTTECAVPDQPRPDGVSLNGVLDPLWPIILHPSDVFDLELPGFQVGSEVDLFLRSAPVELGSRTAGSDGWVWTSLQLPDDVEPGVHRVIARGVAPSGIEMTHTVFVEVPGQPTPGTVVGIHETGFEPLERVRIEFLGTDFGPVVADDRRVMFVEVPVTVLAATQPVALVLTGDSGRVVERTISAVPDPVCEGLEATIVGTGLDDVIEGTNGRDVIVTGHGDDVVRGLNGDDVICSGPGNDTVEGGNGDDLIDLGTGDDVGFGQNGKDELHGGSGNDTLEGENGQDTLDGGPGIDLIDGGRSRDVCTNGETLVACE